MENYDFLLTEAFWMEQVIAAGITAIVTLLVALFAVGPKIVQIGKDMKNQTDHLEGRADSLSRDHSDLKEGVKEAQNAIQNAMRSDMAQLTGMTSFLRDAQIREDARREQLKGQQLDAQRVADSIIAQNVLISELRAEIASLKAELAQLRAQQPRDPIAEAARRMAEEAAAQVPEPEDELEP